MILFGTFNTWSDEITRKQYKEDKQKENGEMRLIQKLLKLYQE